MASIFSNLGPGISKEAGDQADWSRIINGDSGHFNIMQERANEELSKKGRKEGLENVKEKKTSSISRNVKDYLSARDLNYDDNVHLRTKAKIARRSAATAIVGASLLAPRFMSGGNLTTNNKGEKDIAGIPFV